MADINRFIVAGILVTGVVIAALAGSWPLLITSLEDETGMDGSGDPIERGENKTGKLVDLPEGEPPFGDDAPANGSMLYGPTTVENTNILFNLTNDSEKDHKIRVTFYREGEMPMAFEARGEFYDQVNKYITQFGESLILFDEGVVIQYEDLSYQFPFTIHEPLEDHTITDEVIIPPGSHHLVVAVYDVDMELSIETYGGHEALSIRVAEERPGMDQRRWAQLGHWDHVTQEVSVNSQAGLIEASMRMDFTENYRYVMMTSLGDYNELRVTDSQGNECASVGDAYVSRAMLLWSIPVKGEVLIEAKNIAARGVPIISARIIDLPIEFPQSMDGCWTADDPPNGLLYDDP